MTILFNLVKDNIMIENIMFFSFGCLLGLIGMTLQWFVYNKDMEDIADYHSRREKTMGTVIEKLNREIATLKQELKRKTY